MKLIQAKPTANGTGSPLLNEFFTDKFLNWPDSQTEASHSRLPPANIRNSADEWSIELAVPGMAKEAFKVELDKEVLRISAEVEDEGQYRYSLKEFDRSNFERSFRLPKTLVELDKIKARYENGILSISIPKKEEAKPQPKRTIKIS